MGEYRDNRIGLLSVKTPNFDIFVNKEKHVQKDCKYFTDLIQNYVRSPKFIICKLLL